MYQRETWIDWAKTICIFLVVLGHTNIIILQPFIYAFHVPVFFVISGFLYKKNRWQKTFVSLLVPIVFYSCVTFIFRLAINHGDIYKTWEKCTWFVYQLDEKRPLFTGLWFIEVFFVGRLILGDLGFNYLRQRYLIISIICFVIACFIDILNLELNWYITRIIQCFPFFGLGLFLKENTISFLESKLFFILMVGIFVVLAIVNQQCDLMYNRYTRGYPLFFINAVNGCLLLFAICKKLSVNDFVEKCSIGTLVILGTHAMVIDLCRHFFSNKLVVSIMAPFVSLLIAYYIVKICIRFCPALIGKVKS